MPGFLAVLGDVWAMFERCLGDAWAMLELGKTESFDDKKR